MTGPLTLSGAPTIDLHASTKKYVDEQAGGVTDHGLLTGLGDDDHVQYLLINGSRAMTGLLTLSGAPTVDLHAATKKYVDDQAGAPPTKELFFGRLTNDQNMATGGVVYKVNINVADVDTLGGFDSGNHRYVIQNSGYFQLVGQWWKDGPDIEELYQAFIRINGAARASPCTTKQYWMADMVHHISKSGGKDCTPRVFWPVKHLNASDYVDLCANSYTNNQVIQGTEPYCGHKTYLSVIELMRD